MTTLVARRFILLESSTPYAGGVSPQAVVVVPVTSAQFNVSNYLDVMDDGTGDVTSGVQYLAYLYDDGSMTVVFDNFAPGQFLHTYAGWPIPGEPYP